MQKILKLAGYVILALLLVILAGLTWFYFSRTGAELRALAHASPSPPTLSSENFSFRDLNKNGRLDLSKTRANPCMRAWKICSRK